MAHSIINSYRNISNNVKVVKEEDNYEDRFILELIGGPPGSGKTTFRPDAYELDKPELLIIQDEQQITLPDKLLDDKSLNNNGITESE